MNTRNEIKPGPTGELPSVAGADADGGDSYASRKLTLAESVMLTIKLLAGFGLMGAALWGINLWITPE